MSTIPSPEPLASEAVDGLMSKEDKAKVNAYPDTPVTPAVTSVTQANGLTLTAGVLAMASSVANWTVTTLATLTETLTSLVRATGAALVLRSDVGTSASDVCVKVGTSVSNGSVNSSAKLLSIVLGIGGTEVSTAWFTKNGLNLDGRGASNTSPLIFNNLGAGASGILMNKSSGGTLEFTEANYNWGNNLWQIRSTNRPIAISVVGNAYAPGRPQALLLSANYDLTVPVARVAASAGHTGGVWAVAVDTTDVALVSANGRIDQSGTDSSGTPGNATIDKPIGKSAIASGATSVRITNSLVSAGDQVLVTPHGQMGSEWWVTTGAGYFDLNLASAAPGDRAFCWSISKRI